MTTRRQLTILSYVSCCVLGACGSSSPGEAPETGQGGRGAGGVTGGASGSTGGSAGGAASGEAGSTGAGNAGARGMAGTGGRMGSGTGGLRNDAGGPADAGSDATGSVPTGMVRIPAKDKSFMMGFDPAEAPGTIWACYLGKHKVTFTHDFFMDSNLVTQAQFSKVMGFNPSKHVTGDTTLPVDSETWYDAVIYSNKKSQADGLQPAYSYGAVTMNGKSASNIASVTVDITKNGYRLPTNAEYEYAERADTTGLYFFSPTATPNITDLGAVYAWYAGNTGKVSQPVGKRKPNPWGLYDIVGNLFEWEHDWEGPYNTTDEVDPLGPAKGTGCGSSSLGIQKMAKGGSWNTDVQGHMRISYHYKWAPNSVSSEMGFRTVATTTSN